MEFVPGSMKGSKQEETSENEEQGQTEQSRQTVAEENDAEQVKTAGNLEVHFIDVGQGDATLIKCDGHSMLIDAGNNDKGTLVQNYLQHQGVETLDYVIGTHTGLQTTSEEWMSFFINLTVRRSSCRMLQITRALMMMLCRR